MRRTATVLAVVALLGTAGCASTSFDRHVAAGRWAEAAQAFDADSALHADPRAVYRAALIYGSPDLGTYRPDVARQLLERVLQLRPGARDREFALRFIALLDELERLRAESGAREQELRREIHRLNTEATEIRAELDELKARVAAKEEEGTAMRGLIGRLEMALRDRDQQLRTLREELELLKAIDLRATPPRPPGGLR
jgi:signal transduction histidine kinase